MAFSRPGPVIAVCCTLAGLGCDERRPPSADDGGAGSVTISSTARTASTPGDLDATFLVASARDGCLRTGALEAVAADPACVVDHARDDVMRDAPRRLALALTAEPAETTGAATSLLRLSITNVAPSETLVVVEALPASAAPRPDWTRIAGMPEVRGAALGLHVPLTVMTLDARERPVDATPMTSAPHAPPKLLVVRLRPGGKLTHVASWWALRIPAPGPIFKDDAGHVNVPKTLPVPLEQGDYLVRVEVPLFGVPLAERTVTARIRVEEAPRSVAHPH
jgi:hypothetical protein